MKTLSININRININLSYNLEVKTIIKNLKFETDVIILG